jgi:hypothetical protein
VKGRRMFSPKKICLFLCPKSGLSKKMIYHPRGRVALQYPLISSDGIKLVFVGNYFYKIHKADLSISWVYTCS